MKACTISRLGETKAKKVSLGQAEHAAYGLEGRASRGNAPPPAKGS